MTIVFTIINRTLSDPCTKNLGRPGLTLNAFKNAKKRGNYTAISKPINFQKLK